MSGLADPADNNTATTSSESLKAATAAASAANTRRATANSFLFAPGLFELGLLVASCIGWSSVGCSLFNVFRPG